jgi:hypothetical protein
MGPHRSVYGTFAYMYVSLISWVHIRMSDARSRSKRGAVVLTLQESCRVWSR